MKRQGLIAAGLLLLVFPASGLSQALSGAAGLGMQPSPALQPGIPSALGSTGFATRLGTNVGIRSVPPVTTAPGFGNINHPGMQPLPTTVGPFPTTPAGHPNINFPGGTPDMHNPRRAFPDGHFRGRGHGSFDKFHGKFRSPAVVFIGVPFHVPFVVVTQTPVPGVTPVTEPGPFAVAPLPAEPPAPPRPAEPPAGLKTVTLLAFKDSTVIAVVDYWLEGDQVCYEAGSSLRTCVPLDRLDFALTQQLNHERNVRFVLESRP